MTQQLNHSVTKAGISSKPVIPGVVEHEQQPEYEQEYPQNHHQFGRDCRPHYSRQHLYAENEDREHTDQDDESDSEVYEIAAAADDEGEQR